MMNRILVWSCAVIILLPTLAKAERFLIDPNKAETLRCEDAGFKNETYLQKGPEQNFVFNTPDGQTHSIKFENHEECHAKLHVVHEAQLDANHPWVQVDTTPLTFAMIAPPTHADESSRQISSERHSK